MDLEQIETSYKSDGIHTPDQREIIERNKQNTEKLYRLRGTGQIWKVQLKLIINSLDIVIYTFQFIVWDPITREVIS